MGNPAGKNPLPMFDIPLTQTSLDEEEVEAAVAVLRSKWLTMGEQVAAFEDEFARLLGVDHAIAVTNGTAALEIAFLAAGIRPGDEVLLPAITFVACFNALVRIGAVPVLADVNGPEDLTLSPEDCRNHLTRKTRAIVPMPHGGHAPMMHDLADLAREKGLLLVEDACHAPLALEEGRRIGTFGHAAAWSFFGNKNMTTGEGGMITTNDGQVAARCRLLRSHGITRPTWDRARGHASGYDVAMIGTNARMDEVRAAIGRVQTRKLPATTAARALAAQRLGRCLEEKQLDGLILPRARPGTESAHHLFCVLLPEGCPREEVVRAMAGNGIQTSVHYAPLHHFSATGDWLRKHGRIPQLPVTEAVAERILTLPLGPLSTEEEAHRIADSLSSALKP